MLCLRTKRGLPFSCLQVVKILLDSALARTQRDSKVTICHYLWMQNHLHMLLVAHDAQQVTNFYMELQKKITDYFKRLLGREELTLWEGTPSLARVLDIDKAIHEIAYYYLNPAQAHLVEDIRDYPGLSSWDSFLSSIHKGIDARTSREVAWIRQPMIRAVLNGKISIKQDRLLTTELLGKAKVKHSLAINPNAWMRCFGVSNQAQINEINDKIMERIATIQLGLIATRQKENIKVIGTYRLTTAPICFEHRPIKKSRRIFVLSSCREARVNYIRFVKRMTALCKELYQKACSGASVEWPPGVFIPSLPPRASALGFT